MKRGLTFIEGLFSLACIAIVVAVLWPNFLRGRARSKYIGCRGNLMELAAALDTYAADNNGYYPTSLQALAPRYLKAIPGCPAAGRDTYSADYASAELKPVEGVVHCSHGPYPGEKLSQDLQCGKQREELQAVARATSWSAAQQRHLSCEAATVSSNPASRFSAPGTITMARVLRLPKVLQPGGYVAPPLTLSPAARRP